MATSVPTPAAMPPLRVDISQLCGGWKQYPSNLGPRITGMHFSALDGYRKRLEAADNELFVPSEEDVEVRFRDLGFEGQVRTKYNAHGEEKVKRWLGITQARDPSNQRETVTASKEDPKSRFIYVFANSSRDNLRIRRSTLALILTFYQVMPEYLDFFTCFGAQSTPRDVRFSGFRKQVALTRSRTTDTVDALGRSGCQYQVAYNLKGTTRKGESEWAIRNAAFYHRFDVVSGRAIWIVTKGRKDVYESYDELTGEEGRPEDTSFGTSAESFVSSLAPHLLFARWSNDDWRGYVRELEEEVDNESRMAKLGPREKGDLPRHYGTRDVRRMQIWEEQASEVIVILEGNADILASLQQFYQGLAKDGRFPFGDPCAGEISDFASNLDTIISDMNNNIGRAKALIQTIADRKELIKQYRVDDEADRMRRLNENMEQEAIVVRIITLVTLVFLPATFVSTFFSTDIIKYQDDGYPSGKFSQVAMNRWLQVTMPLTALTLGAAWCANQWASRRAARATDGEAIDGEAIDGEAEKSWPLARLWYIIADWLRAHRPVPIAISKESLPLTVDGTQRTEAGPFP